MRTIAPGREPLHIEADREPALAEHRIDVPIARGSRASGRLAALDLWLSRILGDNARWRILGAAIGIGTGAPVGWLLARVW